MSASTSATPTEWLTIRAASALVGVSVATLRRWCDAGLVRVFTTPGGHRRFSRAAVLELVAQRDAITTVAGAEGISAQETLALLVRLREPFLQELSAVCRRRGLDAGATAQMLERANEALDRLLPVAIRDYRGAA